MNPLVFIVVLTCLLTVPVGAQQKYLKPPREAEELFASRPMPRVSLSPDGRHLLVAEQYRFRRIEDLASRVQALAGIRLNPVNNGPALPQYYFRMELREVANGARHQLRLPTGSRRFSLPVWSPDGKHFAFLQYDRASVILHVGEAENRQIKSFPQVRLNAAAGRTFQWLPDSKGLICQSIPKQRGNPPTPPRAPAGPVVQETGPKEAPVLTYPDLLQNDHDEKLFDYYLNKTNILKATNYIIVAKKS